MSIGTDADVDLDGKLDLNLGGTITANADLDLDAKAAVDANLGGTLGLNLAGIPDSFALSVKELPKLLASIDPLDLALKLSPIELSLRFKEIPSVRVHFPTNFRLGLALFGCEFFSASVCGKAQIITEPYVPKPCELSKSRRVSKLNDSKAG